METGWNNRAPITSPGGMRQYTVHPDSAAEVDDTLSAWLRAAYQAAG